MDNAEVFAEKLRAFALDPQVVVEIRNDNLVPGERELALILESVLGFVDLIDPHDPPEQKLGRVAHMLRCYLAGRVGRPLPEMSEMQEEHHAPTH